jgi:hypothetical protein
MNYTVCESRSEDTMVSGLSPPSNSRRRAETGFRMDCFPLLRHRHFSAASSFQIGVSSGRRMASSGRLARVLQQLHTTSSQLSHSSATRSHASLSSGLIALAACSRHSSACLLAEPDCVVFGHGGRIMHKIKLGHCRFQIRPLEVETGQYPAFHGNA